MENPQCRSPFGLGWLSPDPPARPTTPHLSLDEQASSDTTLRGPFRVYADPVATSYSPPDADNVHYVKSEKNSGRPNHRTRRIAPPPVPPSATIDREAKTRLRGGQREPHDVWTDAVARRRSTRRDRCTASDCRTSHAGPAQATDRWPCGPALDFRRLLGALSGLASGSRATESIGGCPASGAPSGAAGSGVKPRLGAARDSASAPDKSRSGQIQKRD